MSILYSYLPEEALSVLQMECFGMSVGTWVTAIIVVVALLAALSLTKKVLKIVLFACAVMFVAMHVVGNMI